MNPEQEWFEEYENDPDYQFELTTIAVGEEIVEALLRLGITRSELAKRLEVSRPRISQILAGDENLTLRTLVGVAVALESRLKIQFQASVSSAKREPGRTDNWLEANLASGPVHQANRQLALAA